MNERIRELAKQAGVYFGEAHKDYFGEEHPAYISTRDIDVEKFAELIVLECSSICYKTLENGDEAASLLMNTFGVEE